MATTDATAPQIVDKRLKYAGEIRAAIRGAHSAISFSKWRLVERNYWHGNSMEYRVMEVSCPDHLDVSSSGQYSIFGNTSARYIHIMPDYHAGFSLSVQKRRFSEKKECFSFLSAELKSS